MKSVKNWTNLLLLFPYLLHHSGLQSFRVVAILFIQALLVYCTFASAPSSETSNEIHFKKLNFNILSGHHLNYLIYNNPPFDNLIWRPDGNYTYNGATKETLQWMARRFNFTYNFILLNKTLATKLGVIDASFYQLVNDKDIDAVNGYFIITTDRKEKAEFVYPFWADTQDIIVPKPGEESRLFSFIWPFQPKVWFMILASVIATVGMLTFLSWSYSRFYYAKNTDDKDSSTKTARHKFAVVNYFSLHMIYVLNILTNQGCREWSNRHSFRIVAGFWVLVGMVLVNSYSGIVISSLTVPKMKPTIGSLEDLANSKDVGVILRSDTVIGQQILSATSGIYKVVGDKARSAPDLIFTERDKLMSKLATGHYAFPFLRTFCIFFIAEQYKKDGHCRFELCKMSSAPTHSYLQVPMKKASPYTHIISKGYIDLWEFGLIEHWMKEITPKAEECFTRKKREKSIPQVPIQLSDLTSAFLILGIGLGSAMLCFLLELTYIRMKRHF